MTLYYNIKTTLEKRQFKMFKFTLFCFFCVLGSFQIDAQDSIPSNKSLTEEANLNFQDFFFKALSEKAIGNHQKAIENLATCNQILENQPAVFFEFSKNYLELNNIVLAREYIDRALEKEPTNFWMLKQLVEVHKRASNFKAAIKVQKQISQNNPAEKENLIKLYFYDRQYKKAISLVNKLEESRGVSRELKRLKGTLKNDVFLKPVPSPQDLTGLIEQFEKEKTYQILEKILNKSIENDSLLNEFSSKGLSLFPAQPFVYLMKAKVLTNQKNYLEALTTLQNGIDFVIDDQMQAKFYIQMAKIYKFLGNKKEEEKYTQKVKQLKS